MKRNAFTLVELSIVLVIIGLLIGGILVGQSLIESAKISGQVKQFQQFDAAVGNFIGKYKSIPGDSITMGCTTSRCGNNIIDDVWATWFSYPSNYGSASFTEETANFWVHLGNSGFIQDGASFTATIPASGFDISSKNRNSPKAAIDSETGVIAGTTGDNARGLGFASVYQIANYKAITGGQLIQDFAANSLTTSQAISIDQKMDDGLPASGKVEYHPVSVGNAYFAGGGASYTTSGCALSASAYNPATSGKVCVLDIQIMSQTGGMLNRGTQN